MKKLVIYSINKIIISELDKDYYKNVKNIEMIKYFYQSSHNCLGLSYSTKGKILVWRNGMYTIKASNQ